jgi:hypothetical protein
MINFLQFFTLQQYPLVDAMHKRGTRSIIGRRMVDVLLFIKEIDDATDTSGAKTPVERDGRAEILERVGMRDVRDAR